MLTKTGLGTVVEEGKQVIEVNGQKYLLETALHADVALTRCRKADPLGNLAYRGSSGHASHPVIATCAPTCPSWSAITSAIWVRSARMK